MWTATATRLESGGQVSLAGRIGLVLGKTWGSSRAKAEIVSGGSGVTQPELEG